ncbi:MAG: outer membrane protein assembly factor BamE [Chthoniobacterales bacterium]
MSPNLVKQGSSFNGDQPMRENYKEKELGDPADCLNRLPLARSGSSLQSMARSGVKALLVLVLMLVIGISCVGKRITKANVDEVAEGMSKKQVESILGPPTSIDNKDFLIMKKTTYVYRQGKDVVTIVFKDDKVQAKDSTLSE